MKRCLKTDMVAHVWAQQNQDEGWNPQKNFYFRGLTIYSYRDSYPIATFVKNTRGERAALFRQDSYSVTTSGHIHAARLAVHGNLFTVHNGYESGRPHHAYNRKDYVWRLDEALLKAARARSSTYALDTAGRLAREANSYAEFFGLKWRVPVPRWSDQYRDELRKRANDQAAKKRKETQARMEKERAELAERVIAWRAGSVDSMPWTFPDTMLRVNGNRIQTSKGAEVPLRIAPAVWALVQEARSKAETLRPALELAQFRLDEVAPDGAIKAGCHRIEYAELLRLAQTLKLERSQ